MKINLKYKLFRIANYGVLENCNFKEKKILQIYNVFLLLVGLNVTVLGILLFVYKFYGQLLFMAISLLAIIFSLYLNKIGYTLISKIFVVQFFILCVLSILCIFSFYTIFPLFFFLIILYYSLIFFEKEKKLMLFFVFECVFFLFLSLTSLHKLLPNYNLLHASKIADMNLICIIAFIFFLFTFIYFHTDYQRKLEIKYINMNNRLQKRNDINEKNNKNNKKLLTIISISLQSNLLQYKTLFNSYLDIKKNNPEKTDQINNVFLLMSEKNKKIEELINFRFTRNREVLLDDMFESCKVKEKSKQILTNLYPNLFIVNIEDDFIINTHLDLYKNFLIEIINDLNSLYLPKKIMLNFDIYNTIDATIIENLSYNIFGINVSHKIDNQQEILQINFYFFKKVNKTAIYYV